MNSLKISTIALIALSVTTISCTSNLESKSLPADDGSQLNLQSNENISSEVTTPQVNEAQVFEDEKPSTIKPVNITTANEIKPITIVKPNIPNIRPEILTTITNAQTNNIKPTTVKPILSDILENLNNSNSTTVKPIQNQEVYSATNSWPNQVRKYVNDEKTKGYRRPALLPVCTNLYSMIQHFGCSVSGGNGFAADVRIYLADPKAPIKKVAFILAPHNFENPSSINKEARATALINGAESMYTELLHKGVSIAFIAYGYKDYYLKGLKEKAAATTKAINLINSIKPDNSESILMGLSLGGVIGRIALRDMEIKGQDHKVSQYLSFDSPHRGAHVALGLQHLMRFLKKGTAHASKEARNFKKIFGGFIDDILDLDNLANQLDQGIEAGEFVSDQVKLFSDIFLNSAFAQELIIQQISQDKTNYFNVSFVDMQKYLNTIGMPKNTIKNIGITNGSISGNPMQLKGDYYVSLETPLKDYTQINFKSYIAKDETQHIFKGVLKYPDPSELGGFFGGSGTDSYTYTFHQQSAHLDLDRGTCGYLNAINDIEEALNSAVRQHFGASLDIKNKNMCFIPTTSGLLFRKNLAYKGQITAQDSLFDEIVGSALNTHHLQHTSTITTAIKKAFNEAY